MSGPECCENPPKLSSDNSGGEAGHVQQLGGFSCYISGPPHSTLALLLVSDVFGKFFLFSFQDFWNFRFLLEADIESLKKNLVWWFLLIEIHI